MSVILTFIWLRFPLSQSGQLGVSCEAQLFGTLAGVTATLLLRSPVHAPSLRSVD